jgi:hypothetical protein
MWKARWGRWTAAAWWGVYLSRHLGVDGWVVFIVKYQAARRREMAEIENAKRIKAP